MAEIKISQLPSLSTGSLSAVIPTSLGGTTYKISLDTIKNTINDTPSVVSTQMFMHPQTITENITIPNNYNAFLIGPVGVDGTIIVGSGSNLSIL